MWQISGDENSHLAYMWQVATGKSHFGGTFFVVRGHVYADHLPHISEIAFSHSPNPPPVRQMRKNPHPAKRGYLCSMLAAKINNGSAANA